MRRASFLIGLLVLVPLQAVGQDRGLELGAAVTPIGLTFAGERSSLVVSYAAIAVSASFFRSARVAFEPRISARILPSGIDGLLDFGVPLYLRPTSGRSGPYVRPMIGASIADRSVSGDPRFQLVAGIGIGGKFPLRERLSLRLEAAARRHVHNDLSGGSTRFAALVGFSLFTR